MTVTPRILLTSICASAVFGGGIGALATAATSSQASPQAIAAAVLKVADQRAETELRHIALWTSLAHLDLEELSQHQREYQATESALLERIAKNASGTCWAVSSPAQRAADCGP